MASLDELGAIIEELGAIASLELDGAMALDDTAELDGRAELDDTAELEDEAGGVTTTAVVLGRLKMKIRPMITITATMMMIQVLRFIGSAFRDG
ncbi:MAG: hypothetical protein ABL879_07560 [Devosia sp.]